ncbi:MAG: Fic family protein [Clostridia bacterium]|jgi:Fic family protein
MDKYNPPYDITDDMLVLVSEIMEQLGHLNAINDLEKLPRLRRISRIKSIHSSLAIENNTLTIAQVEDVINGKRVLGPQEDIQEVKNAFEAYKQIKNLDVFNVDKLLEVHAVMMKGLVAQVGQFRTTQVGVYNSNGKLIHMGTPQEFVPVQMIALFDWLKESKSNMLIKSSVFHYEFEFIHPFQDGNGRMGRLWQTALLAEWKSIFEWIPIESIIKDNQQQYYDAIKKSTSEGKSNQFILFMLDVINKAIKDITKDTRNYYHHINNQIKALLDIMENYTMSAVEIMELLGLKSRDGFRKNYLTPALEAGLIGMTIPEKPTSKNQRYFKL